MTPADIRRAALLEAARLADKIGRTAMGDYVALRIRELAYAAAPTPETWDGLQAQLADLLVLINGLNHIFNWSDNWKNGDPPLTGARVLELVRAALTAETEAREKAEAERDAATVRAEAAEARIKALEEGLRPFGSCASEFGPQWLDHESHSNGSAWNAITVGHLRRAAALLNKDTET